MYFLKDKAWNEVHKGIFGKVYSLDKLELDGVLPMIGLRMDCCLGNRAEVVSTPVVLSLLDNTLTGSIIYYEWITACHVPSNAVQTQAVE